MDLNRVEAGRKGARAMWQKRRKREAEIAAKIALWDEVVELLGLLAHPKFTTDDQGRIQYYVTKSDVEAARVLQDRIEREVKGNDGE